MKNREKKEIRTYTFKKNLYNPLYINGVLVKYPYHQEYQYLDIIKTILETGVESGDRTNVGTIRKFGAEMRFDLSESFPLLTTKKVLWDLVLKEFIWFLKGQTDSKILEAQKVNIWKSNASREFLDKNNLCHREVGDLGPIYGFQWRHFGAEYIDCHADYSGKGVDQIMYIINTIKNNPTSRRLILSAWNPCDIEKMALPPCHLLAQFIANPEKKELSCILYQRSADTALGVPFNIASYSLLCMVIGKLTGYKPKEFIHYLGDIHIYKTHIEPIKQQIERHPRPFPTLKIDEINNIEDVTVDKFHLNDYYPDEHIKFEFAV